MIWFENPLRFSPHSEIMSLNAIYPLSLAQNVMTTGLITLKIWNQHRNSAASGVIDRSSRLSLLKIVRIIIESAMIYTGQLFVLVILYFANNTFQYVVQNAIVPSLGKHSINNILLFSLNYPHCRYRLRAYRSTGPQRQAAQCPNRN